MKGKLRYCHIFVQACTLLQVLNCAGYKPGDQACCFGKMEEENPKFCIVCESTHVYYHSQALKLNPYVDFSQIPDIPFLILAATSRDQYRKPIPGMWWELQKLWENKGVEIGEHPSNNTGEGLSFIIILPRQRQNFLRW